MRYLKELDGVRGIAALMIVVFHFFLHLETSNPNWILLKKLSIPAQTGVSLFFILSGFLITRILLKTKSENGYFTNFYVRRILRIFPLYYLFLVIYYFVVPALTNEGVVPVMSQIYYWFYLQNFALTFNWDAIGPRHFWSLAVEEHFYLFWPFIIYLFNKKNVIRIVFLIIIIAIITRFVLLQHNLNTYYFTLTRIDELAIGALLAFLEIKEVLKPKNANKLLWLLIAFAIPAVLMWTYFTGKENYWLKLFKFNMIAFVYFLFTALVISIRDDHWLKRGLSTSAAVYTGKISYGIYVYHPLCFLLADVFPFTGSVTGKFITGILYTYVVASLSYYLFEQRFLLLKKKFRYRTV